MPLFRGRLVDHENELYIDIRRMELRQMEHYLEVDLTLSSVEDGYGYWEAQCTCKRMLGGVYGVDRVAINWRNYRTNDLMDVRIERFNRDQNGVDLLIRITQENEDYRYIGSVESIKEALLTANDLLRRDDAVLSGTIEGLTYAGEIKVEQDCFTACITNLKQADGIWHVSIEGRDQKGKFTAIGDAPVMGERNKVTFKEVYVFRRGRSTEEVFSLRLMIASGKTGELSLKGTWKEDKDGKWSITGSLDRARKVLPAPCLHSIRDERMPYLGSKIREDRARHRASLR